MKFLAEENLSEIRPFPGKRLRVGDQAVVMLTGMTDATWFILGPLAHPSRLGDVTASSLSLGLYRLEGADRRKRYSRRRTG